MTPQESRRRRFLRLAVVGAAAWCACAQAVELHTGQYAVGGAADRAGELARLVAGGRQIRQLGMILNAGHGLNSQNVQRLSQLSEIVEFNIGHSIVARAVLVGLDQAVREMKALLD